ncbi:hypothetical protein CFC21_027462 [Triticum aestivum]|uniref:Pectinesterase inhibitor domain-containing protein n=2 Tax=Triticum aestivum TaxID=4565 RepID=A0A3B6D5S8_WHEAT|nr:putative invertase inhibitor [Aegilops tauschii subsp. strangulata]KAF7013376.1 hypothetical protein CFC21_027462 [Triticum aestivum]
MAPLRALSSVLLLLLVQHARTARASTLEDTCRLVGTGGAQDYDFCVKTLGADPASATADELGLAVIALRMARATAKATGDHIAQLQAAETSPRWRLGLDECAKDYAWTVSRLGRAAKDFATGGDEDRLTEVTALLEVRGTPVRCDKMFAFWAGESSPLTDADRELDGVIELAFNILWHAVNNGAK